MAFGMDGQNLLSVLGLRGQWMQTRPDVDRHELDASGEWEVIMHERAARGPNVQMPGVSDLDPNSSRG